jgi:hypothetical protein
MILETKPRPMDLDIVAYKLPDGLWAFDYEPNETVEELLCNGTEKVIDSYYYFTTGKEAVAGSKMRIYLSDEELDEWDTRLNFMEDDEDGNTYLDIVMCDNVWLCRWLNDYFGCAPDYLWIQVDPINDGLDAFNKRTKEAIQTHFSKTVFNKGA